ncbi:hypothetical protein Cs7R123_66720 [Catellatospora sp. TT07R-123]|nr:hypothetical protein Cs7R123_66720 [Catellatospora sp. TT07R-123]
MLVVTVLAGVASLLIAAPAQAAGACGSACNYTWPDETAPNGVVCASGATTPVSAYSSSHGLTVQLRYSPTCRTVWGRIYGGLNQYYYIHMRRKWVSASTGEVTYEYFTADQIGPPSNRPHEWGKQFDDAGYKTEACASTSWSTSGIFLCTSAY